MLSEGFVYANIEQNVLQKKQKGTKCSLLLLIITVLNYKSMCRAVSQRFKSVIDYLKSNEYVYNEADFARKLDVGRSFISDMKAGRREITEQTVLKICDLFPFINFEWLLTGSGTMIINMFDSGEPAAVSPPNFDDQEGGVASSSVSVSKEAWDIIKMQASSLERKDRQLDRVIGLLEDQLSGGERGVPGGTKRKNDAVG